MAKFIRKDRMNISRKARHALGKLSALLALRFYPPNAYAQCQKHHWNHHNKKEWADAYDDWLRRNHLEELEAMEGLRHRFIKYDDDLKAEIIRLCNADKLYELKELIEENLK